MFKSVVVEKLGSVICISNDAWNLDLAGDKSEEDFKKFRLHL